MLKKLVISVFVVAFALSFTSCKKDAEEKLQRAEFAQKMLVLMEDINAKIVNAEDAAGVAAALNEFADAKEQFKAEKCAKKGDKKKDCADKKDCKKGKKGKCELFSAEAKAQVENYKDDPAVAAALARFKKDCPKEGDCDKAKKGDCGNKGDCGKKGKK